jgi:hypothetical protein
MDSFTDPTSIVIRVIASFVTMTARDPRITAFFDQFVRFGGRSSHMENGSFFRSYSIDPMIHMSRIHGSIDHPEALYGVFLFVKSMLHQSGFDCKASLGWTL